MAKKPIVYAFIDSQNLNLGLLHDVRDQRGRIIYKGFKLDFRKFRTYLRDKYDVSEAFIFVGFMPGNTALYTSLQKFGYTLILKSTTTYKNSEGKVVVKGNVDTDLVLYSAAIEFGHYDKAVVVSGDGDFASLYEYLISKNKLAKILVPNRRKYSSLLKKYHSYLSFVSDVKSLEWRIKKTRSSGRPKP